MVAYACPGAQKAPKAANDQNRPRHPKRREGGAAQDTELLTWPLKTVFTLLIL